MALPTSMWCSATVVVVTFNVSVANASLCFRKSSSICFLVESAIPFKVIASKTFWRSFSKSTIVDGVLIASGVTELISPSPSAVEADPSSPLRVEASHWSNGSSSTMAHTGNESFRLSPSSCNGSTVRTLTKRT